MICWAAMETGAMMSRAAGSSRRLAKLKMFIRLSIYN
jgi:hypothetical protein